MNNNTIIPQGFIIDFDAPYYTAALEEPPEESAPTATIIEGNTEINLSDTTWQTSQLFAPCDYVSDADIIAYARARHWSVFAIVSVDFAEPNGNTDPDDEPTGWIIVGK